MIKGIIYSLALLLSLFLVVALLEYFGYFGTGVRAFLFWFYLVSAVAILCFYVVWPLTKMFRLGKVMSYDEAARIVGGHFPEVKDKLLNLLQLQQQEMASDDSLLVSAIEQKTAQLSPLPFHQAIDLKANRRYVKYAAVPLLIVLVLLLVSPALLISSSHRITHYNTYFERPAPFSFVVENKVLETAQHDDFELHVSVQGESVPAEAFINVEGNVYKMTQVDKSHFSYVFKTVQRSCTFFMQEEVDTDKLAELADYELNVIPKPAIVDFQTALSYPVYTSKKNESLANEGDLVVPEGTYIKWLFNTQNVDSLYLVIENHKMVVVPDENGRASLTYRALHSFEYSFYADNKFNLSSDSLKYAVSTIPDAVPIISAVELRDSALFDRLLFQGKIKDDYGFSRLVFKMVKTNEKDTTSKDITTVDLALTSDVVQDFYYSTDLSEIELAPGDKLVYYFEVWDNDAIHGPKSASSQKFEVSIPSAKELDNILERNSSEAQHSAQKSISELKKMQQDINELMRKMVDKKDLDWQDKKDLAELAKKQKEIKQMLQQIQSQLLENKQLEQKFKDQSEQLLQKQQELDGLMNEVLNDEMKKMMQEMDKLMQEMDKKKVQEQLEKMKMDNENLEKQIDQNIELMKRLEVEKNVEDAIQKAETLAKEQRKLAEKTEQAKGKDEKDNLLKEQQRLSQDFENLKKEIDKIKSDYKQIDENIDFKVDKEQLKKIDDNQQNAEHNTEKGKFKDASKQQKDAAQQLDELSEQLAEAQQDIEQQDLAEDAEQIRLLLKNLVKLSFNQESLIGQINSIYIQDPKYQSVIVSQNKIKDDFRGVEDSLRAIAKRQIAVAKVINNNIGDVNNNLSRSLNGLLEMNQSFYGSYKNSQSSQFMQYAMTSFNNLALVMAESLDQMQNQMRQNQQKKNNGSCKNPGMKMKSNCSKPGNGKPSPKSMKQMQQELNKQMEALKKQLEKQGKSTPNSRKKIGDHSSTQISEEFAKMAAQQEMIRRMMQEYGQEMKQANGGNSKLTREIDQLIKQMEQTETDLVNRVISQQTINRQQQIMTRLLEHEKAEMQREKEERRESREGTDKPHQTSQSDLEKLKKLQNSSSDLFRTLPPSLSPYYKAKVQDYFYKF